MRRRRALALLAVVAMLGLPATLAAAEGAVVRDAPEVGGGQGATGADPAVARAPGHDQRSGYVVIGEGDTVWDLVLPHTPPGADPAAYVAEVVAANGLDPRALTQGTVIRLP